MAAPDFYFAINATARYIHDQYGWDMLVDYWRSLGREYYAQRCDEWQRGGLPKVAEDWRAYFLNEPGAEVNVSCEQDGVHLDVRICPAIKHLRDCGRDIVPYFCEHCDHTCGSMAQVAGLTFTLVGGMGRCHQVFALSKTSNEREPPC